VSGSASQPRRNARLTLFGQLLNIIAGSSFAASVVAPIAAVFYTGAAIPLRQLAFGAILWLGATSLVHAIAQWTGFRSSSSLSCRS
jgi:hypothetical protein